MQNFKSIEELKAQIEQNSTFKFQIKAVANSKNNSIEFLEDFIKVKIKERAMEGKANKAIVEFLAKTLGYPKSKVAVLNGEKSPIKTIIVKP